MAGKTIYRLFTTDTNFIDFNNSLNAENYKENNSINNTIQEVIVDEESVSINFAALVEDAINFGNQILKEFIIENVSLGITQRGLTEHVRIVTKELITCLQTGSLYDGINELKKINPQDLDSVILSESRLLIFRNKIHTYLSIPEVSIWNQ